MTLRDVARYLVVKALVGRNIIEPLYEYLVLNKPISEVAERHGLTKNQLRGYADRIREKSFGSYARARAYLKALYPFIKKIKPIFICDEDGYCMCVLCKKVVGNGGYERHIETNHLDVVVKHVYTIIESVREKILNGRKVVE
ncbi:MAG: hypothetical protein JRD89_19370 [Deltaproteobacteria bacterium]|nr:hypothetical protein [Deltaproteobacteria bacterium]